MFFDIESCKKVQTKCTNWKDCTNFRAEICMFLKKAYVDKSIIRFFLELVFSLWYIYYTKQCFR